MRHAPRGFHSAMRYIGLGIVLGTVLVFVACATPPGPLDNSLDVQSGVAAALGLEPHEAPTNLATDLGAAKPLVDLTAPK